MSPPSEKPACILVVDDDADIRRSLELTLQYEGYEVWTARDGQEALARMEREGERGRVPAVVLSDVKMPRLDGLALLEALVQRNDPPAVLMISGHGDIPMAVDAVKRGAFYFLEKPLDQERLLLLIGSALRARLLERENQRLRSQIAAPWTLVGGSAAMQALRESVTRVARSDASVLISGENGTGKELVARQVHLQGPRSAGPFVTVNCAAIPAELIESELFGHEKGSFTGAHDRRVGHFEAADGGTLFLDEIGDMPLPAQAKLLRALETHEITRVGGSRPRAVDIRVVAATNTDLARAVEEKTFRVDLYFRLNVVPLAVPSLRERLEDVPALVEHFLHQILQRAGRAAWSVAPDALEFLASLPYPGNVRQLRNLIEGLSVLAPGPQITRADCEQLLATGPGLARARSAGEAAAGDPFLAPTFEEFKDLSEALFFQRKLAENGGNVKRTAELLGMQRSHLYKKLERYHLR